MNVTRHLALLALPVVLAGVVACSSGSKPGISFAEPKDGATVKSPVHMKFAAENITISPVPAGDITTVRPGMGHYHLAIDTECMATGVAIPKGVNWIHYGKGDTEADTQLTPGSHKLTLAIGDDKHMTMEGLCKTITVNVAP